MMEWLILGKTALIYSVVTLYLGLRPRIIPSITFLRFKYNENSVIKSANCDTTNPILLFRILRLLFSKCTPLIN